MIESVHKYWLNSKFPFHGYHIKFGFFSKNFSNYDTTTFDPTRFEQDDIIRLRDTGDDNILDIRRKDAQPEEQFNMLPYLNLMELDFKHLHVPANTVVLACKDEYDVIKNDIACNPFQPTNSTACPLTTCRNLTNGDYTLRAGNIDQFGLRVRSMYVNPKRRYQYGYGGYSNNFVEVCQDNTRSRCLNVMRADKVDWNGVANLSMETPFGFPDIAEPTNHIISTLSTVQPESLEAYDIELYTELQGIGIGDSDRLKRRGKDYVAKFRFSDIIVTSVSSTGFEGRLKQNGRYVVIDGSNVKLSSTNPYDYTFRFMKENSHENAVVISYGDHDGSRSGYLNMDTSGYLVTVNTLDEARVFYLKMTMDHIFDSLFESCPQSGDRDNVSEYQLDYVFRFYTDPGKTNGMSVFEHDNEALPLGIIESSSVSDFRFHRMVKFAEKVQITLVTDDHVKLTHDRYVARFNSDLL